ncbi:MAG TPA: hypothetical protein VFK01_01125, partial [Bradyrhizobium sp.]|nr:hypothetical protein [Bradyrhizobium sp.]
GNGIDPGMDPFQNGLAGINRIVMVEMIVAHEVLLTFRPDLGAAKRFQTPSWNPALLRVQDKNRRSLPMFHQNSAGVAESLRAGFVCQTGRAGEYSSHK